MIAAPYPPAVGYACQICGEERGTTHAVREMMFGFRDTFHYFECAGCGCLQLTDPPAEMARYYPQDYYSFEELPAPKVSGRNSIKQWLFRKLAAAQIFDGNWFWRLLASLRPVGHFEDVSRLFRHTNVSTLDARILDVGCGSGKLLRRLLEVGFRRLNGIDPNLPNEIRFGTELCIQAKTLEQVNDREFDLILFDHSLEHIADQIGTLKTVQRLLSRDGVCIVQIPIAASDVWKDYGVDWVELDAPRHYFIHTPASFRIAANRAGLEVYHLEYEGVAGAYWISELYKRDIPYFSKDHLIEPTSMFSAEELAVFEQRAEQANAAGHGGRGAFYFRRQSQANDSHHT